MKRSARRAEPAGNVDDPRDTAAILARRAALVASALSSFTLTVRAEAQAQKMITEGPCASGAAPTDAAKAEAKVRFELALKLMKEGVFDQASVEARHAYERMPHEKIALLALDADLARSAFAAAHELAQLHERCFGATPEISARKEKARAASGHVTFAWQAMPEATLEVDGAPLSVEQTSFGVRLASGEHRAVLHFQGRSSEATFNVVAGEDLTVTMGPLGPEPMPCLSMIPDYDDRQTVLRFQAGLMPLLGVHVAEPTELSGGPGLFQEISGQPTEALWLEANLFQCVSFNERVAYGWIGGGVDVQYRFSSVAFGLGFAGGGLITPEQSPRANGFFGPVIIPFSLAEGLLFLEARVPIWLTPVVGFEPKLELGMLATHLVIGIGGPVIEEGGYAGSN